MWPTNNLQSNPAFPKVTVVDVSDDPVPEIQLVQIYGWLDSLKFSRSKKISPHRDFADGVMMAELVDQYIPKVINRLEYIPASASAKKRYNWEHMNSKVFKRIRFQLTPEMIKQVSEAKPGMIERVLLPLHNILQLGSLAVVPPSKRLEHVKSRFMNIQRAFPKPKTKTEFSDIPYGESSPGTEMPMSSSARPYLPPGMPSEDHESHRRIQYHEAYHHHDDDDNGSIGRSGYAPKSLEYSRPATTNATAKSTDGQLSSNFPHPNNYDYEYLLAASKAQYEILARPSSASSSEPSTPRNISSRPHTANSNRNHRNCKVQRKPNILNDNEECSTQSIDYGSTNQWKSSQKIPTSYALVPKENERNQKIIATEKGDARSYTSQEDDVYDEIYCHLEEDDDEDDKDYEAVAKRKMKKVRKYEYREEYILNGVPVGASVYSGPNRFVQKGIQKDYLKPIKGRNNSSH